MFLTRLLYETRRLAFQGLGHTFVSRSRCIARCTLFEDAYSIVSLSFKQACDEERNTDLQRFSDTSRKKVRNTRNCAYAPCLLYINDTQTFVEIKSKASLSFYSFSEGGRRFSKRDKLDEDRGRFQETCHASGSTIGTETAEKKVERGSRLGLEYQEYGQINRLIDR